MPLWHNAIEPFEMYMRKWAEIGQKLGGIYAICVN